MKISVAMASYNGEKFILEQLASIYNQTRKVDEIVIVDDCSKDGTVAAILGFLEEHSECKIHLYENAKNLGYKKNFHKAMSLCEGDIILLCDQDDVWLENKVEKLLEIFQANDDVSLVSSSFKKMNNGGKINDKIDSAYRRKIKEKALVPVPIEDLVFHNISQGCAMALRKEIRDLYLKFFTEELPHDWVLNIIATMKKKCYYLNEVLFLYRIHDNNTIGLNENLTIQKKNSIDVRTHDARQAVKVLNFIKDIDEMYYKENDWLVKADFFAKEHIACIEERKMFSVMLQNFNSCYRKLKTFRGRLLDMFFCMKK